MDESAIEEKVISIVAEQLTKEKSEIKRDTHFVTDLNADSLDVVELLMALEDEFQTNIAEEEAEKIQTVGDAIEFIKNGLNAAGSDSKVNSSDTTE
ncbi:MAG: acyl carrier protein [Phycisphaeraceae bacterium]|nr:acyl carrier protein [Phycisphaeraceae bacterium]